MCDAQWLWRFCGQPYSVIPHGKVPRRHLTIKADQVNCIGIPIRTAYDRAPRFVNFSNIGLPLYMDLVANNLKGLPKHLRVYEELARRVRGMRPGEKLPPVRQLMGDYGVSQVTVDRAISALRDDGLVRSEVGKGCFVTRPHDEVEAGQLPAQVEVIFFTLVDKPEDRSFHRDLLDRLSRQLGERHAGLRLRALRPDASAGELEALLDRDRPAATIVINLFNPDVAKVLRERLIPHVLLFPNWPSDLSNSLYIDNHSLVQHWVEHLAGLGHRRIAHLHGVSKDVYYRDMDQRKNLLMMELGRNGLYVDPALSVCGGFTREEGYAAASRLLDQNPDVTAIIINDSVAGGVYRAIAERGLEIGRDISVIGTDDLDWAAHLEPALTTTRISRDGLAKSALQILESAIADPKADLEPQFVQADLVVRGSTCKAPDQP